MDLYLLSIIYQMLADMDNTDLNYIIYARYNFFDQQMQHFEGVHISRDSIQEIELTEDALGLKMPLDAPGDDKSYSVIIPFDTIRQVEKIQFDQVPKHTILWKSEAYKL